MNNRKKINIIKEIADQNNVVYKETNKHLLIPKENNMSKQKITLELIYKELIEFKKEFYEFKQETNQKFDVIDKKFDLLFSLPTIKKELHEK